jgi:CO dehydrogenase maturation factor
LLGQLEAGDRVVVADMEAGAGTLTRMPEGSLDLALLVTEPSPKSIEVARRAAEIISERKLGPMLVVANKVRDARDLEMIRLALGVTELVAVPDDAEVLRADRDGVSPFDSAPDSAAVAAVSALGLRITSRARLSPG